MLLIICLKDIFLTKDVMDKCMEELDYLEENYEDLSLISLKKFKT